MPLTSNPSASAITPSARVSRRRGTSAFAGSDSAADSPRRTAMRRSASLVCVEGSSDESPARSSALMSRLGVRPVWRSSATAA